MDVPIFDTAKFPSPQAWHSAWARKNKKRLPSLVQERAVTPELDFSPKNEPLPEAVEVEVVPDELTEDQQRERLHLERKVERAFYEAGKALRELRDRRLYRSTHKTFEEYCLERFGFKRRHPYQLINAAEVVDNLLEMCANRAQNFCGAPALPTSEYQVRPLVGLEPEQQRQAWRQAVEETKGKVPSSRLVKDIVQRIRERTPVPNPYKVGEVCQLIALDNPELRGKGGCWCIVSEVHDFGCTVTTWSGSYTIRLEHLKSLDYSSSECQRMKGLCARLTRLHETGNLDASAYWILNGLGKLPKPELTPTEEKLLSVLESEYGLKTTSESKTAQEETMEVTRPDSSQKKNAPAKIEANTNDILIAFLSNLDSLSTAHISAVGKALASSEPDKASVMATSCAVSSSQAVAIVKALTLIYPEAIRDIRDLIEEINNNSTPL